MFANRDLPFAAQELEQLRATLVRQIQVFALANVASYIASVNLLIRRLAYLNTIYMDIRTLRADAIL
jgi:hypothetical protein